MKIGWKEKVPDDVLDEIIKWRDSIPHLKKVFIPRWTAGLGFEDAEASLCCFSDASIDGYGCCAYVVRSLKGENTKKKVAFLMSKAHVVPIQMARKPIEEQENHCDSIPRLELVASLASAMMRDLLIRVSGENFTHVTMFSDSVTVLKWIGSLWMVNIQVATLLGLFVCVCVCVCVRLCVCLRVCFCAFKKVLACRIIISLLYFAHCLRDRVRVKHRCTNSLLKAQ